MVCKFNKFTCHFLMDYKEDKFMENLRLLDYTKRKLDSMYPIIYAIKNSINIKKIETIEKIDIYTFVGVNHDGYRELLGIYQDKTLTNRYWLDVFESLKSRGLNDVLFMSIDDNKNMKKTAKIAFPTINFVDSFTSIVAKFDRYTSEKSTRRVASRIYKLYSQPTLTTFKNELINFKDTYNNAIHQKLTLKYLGNLEGYYKYSVNIRKLLFKPSSNTRIYDRIRVSFNSNENYITDLNGVYGKLESTEKFFGIMPFNKNEWALILNDLILMFPDKEFI